MGQPITVPIRAANKETLDHVLVEEMEKERNYWREVLERIVSTVKFLAVRGLGTVRLTCVVVVSRYIEKNRYIVSI